jgi:hypothetical protein
VREDSVDVTGKESGCCGGREKSSGRSNVQMRGQKNAGLKVVTLIATLNPVSQVLW